MSDTSEHLEEARRRVLVEVTYIVEIDDPTNDDMTLADLADYDDFCLDYLRNDLRVVEFDGHRVLTDPDEVSWYDGMESRWSLRIVTS